MGHCVFLARPSSTSLGFNSVARAGLSGALHSLPLGDRGNRLRIFGSAITAIAAALARRAWTGVHRGRCAFPGKKRGFPLGAWATDRFYVGNGSGPDVRVQV